MTLTANWSYPTAVRFGAGRISELAEACKVAGIRRPLLVTDRGLASIAITQRSWDARKSNTRALGNFRRNATDPSAIAPCS